MSSLLILPLYTPKTEHFWFSEKIEKKHYREMSSVLIQCGEKYLKQSFEASLVLAKSYYRAAWSSSVVWRVW